MLKRQNDVPSQRCKSPVYDWQNASPKDIVVMPSKVQIKRVLVVEHCRDQCPELVAESGLGANCGVSQVVRTRRTFSSSKLRCWRLLLCHVRSTTEKILRARSQGAVELVVWCELNLECDACRSSQLMLGFTFARCSRSSAAANVGVKLTA
jgi:hypothetical protein